MLEETADYTKTTNNFLYRTSIYLRPITDGLKLFNIKWQKDDDNHNSMFFPYYWQPFLTVGPALQSL